MATEQTTKKKKEKLSKRTLRARIIAVVLAVAMLSTLGIVGALITSEESLSAIIFTNDVKGNVETDVNVIGLPVVGSVFSNVSEQVEGRAILIDGGNSLHGANLTDRSQGELTARLYQAMGYSAMNVGCNDLNYGPERILQLMNDYSLPFVSCNILVDGERVFDSYRIVQLGRLKIAFIGVCGEYSDSEIYSQYRANYEILDPLTSVKETVEEIGNSANVIVLISQLDDVYSDLFAQEIPSISYIFAEHGEIEVEDRTNGTTAIFGAKGSGAEFGLLEISSKGKTIVNDYYQRITASQAAVSGVADENLSAIIAEHNAQYSDDALAENCDVILTLVGGASARMGETNFGDAVADFMNEFCSTDVALVNAGAFRSSVEASVATRNAFLEAMPFENVIVTTNISGADLKTVLEKSFAIVGQDHESFLQVGGMTFTADLTAPEGERITELKIGGQDYDPQTSYSLATVANLLSGNDTYPELAALKINDSYGNLGAMYADYAIELRTVRAETDGRMNIIQ